MCNCPGAPIPMLDNDLLESLIIALPYRSHVICCACGDTAKDCSRSGRRSGCPALAIPAHDVGPTICIAHCPHICAAHRRDAVEYPVWRVGNL